MAVLRSDVKRVTISVPKSFLRDLDTHLKNFALTDRSKWILEAAKEKIAQERILLTEIQDRKEQNE
ncbi:putative nickel-responsive regulator (plasmid) [Candidatus Megaera polyxenophila]|jgi:metal-responsive CopG/Arc/MetJ family transcriptional regulator|nr:putative nickel-responsive regulator [Candidatus Megaera polyxenophila]